MKLLKRPYLEPDTLEDFLAEYQAEEGEPHGLSGVHEEFESEVQTIDETVAHPAGSACKPP